MIANMRNIFSVFYSTSTVFLLLTMTLIFYSHSSFSENRSENANSAVEKQKTKEIQRIKNKLKDTQKNMATQKEKKAALETQLQELENQVRLLLKQNAEKDSKLKDFKRQKPNQSN